MYEHHKDPLLPRRAFLLRFLRNAGIATLLMLAALGIGIFGYDYFGGLEWLDALLNASMILTGMGPVDPMRSASGKLFASFYALFSGLVFPTTIGVMMAPVVHRFLHRLHLDEDDDEEDEEDASTEKPARKPSSKKE